LDSHLHTSIQGLFAIVSLIAVVQANIINIALPDQTHKQQGQAGKAVTGSYSFTDDKGVTWTTKYIADDKGYRVIGRTTTFTGKVPAPVPESVPEKIPTPAPAPAPVYFIVAAPTLPSYDAPFLSGFPSFFYPGNFRYIG